MKTRTIFIEVSNYLVMLCGSVNAAILHDFDNIICVNSRHAKLYYICGVPVWSNITITYTI